MARRILTKDSELKASGDSGIRKMFMLGKQMEAEGKHPIDLSLGNPCEGPPNAYYRALLGIISEDMQESYGSGNNPHGYIPNAGLPAARERVASDLSKRFGLPFKNENAFITAGAANALDVILRTLLEPVMVFKESITGAVLRDDAKLHRVSGGETCILPDEVIVPAPFFVEYGSYCRNNQGLLIPVKTDNHFHLDVDAIASRVNKKTRIVLLNSPKNPTGAIDNGREYADLADALNRKNEGLGIRVVVVEDAPYNPIVFGENKFETMMHHYPHTIFVDSFSKTWGIAGERLGYMLVHPQMLEEEERDAFYAALTANMRNRVVNAPLLQQRILARIGCNTTCDVKKYETRVRKLEAGLMDCGFKVISPQGTFFLFPEIPNRFDSLTDFQKAAFDGDDPLLYVPGPAFAPEMSGYVERNIRLGACVSDETINRACDKLKRICK